MGTVRDCILTLKNKGCNGCKWWAMFGENGWCHEEQKEDHLKKVTYLKEQIRKLQSNANHEIKEGQK
jgi:hypothetical protein